MRINFSLFVILVLLHVTGFCLANTKIKKESTTGPSLDLEAIGGLPPLILNDTVKWRIPANGTLNVLPDNEPTPKGPQPAVVNGFTVGRNQVPFIVSLQREGAHFCGGSIISNYHILTAAHCIFELRQGTKGRKNSDYVRKGINDFVVGIGLNDRKADSRHFIRVQKIQTHSGYDIENLYVNDIALLTLASPISSRIAMGMKASAVSLPADYQDNPKPNQEAVAVAGWGLTQNDDGRSELPRFLQAATFTPLFQKECARRTGEIEQPGKVCVDSSITASCMGDSGGPMFRVKRGTYQLVGIASYVMGLCQKKGTANVFTRVSQFLPWIRQAVRNGPYNPAKGSSDVGNYQAANQCRVVANNSGYRCQICRTSGVLTVSCGRTIAHNYSHNWNRYRYSYSY